MTEPTYRIADIFREKADEYELGIFHPVRKELLESDTLTGPVTQIAVGADLDLSNRPAAQLEAFQLPEPVSIGGRKVEWFNVKNYAFDPSVDPRGKSLLLSMFLCEWPFWEKFKGDPAAYKAEKERTAEACIGALETRYPGIRDKVEMVDIATPLTYERYTGNWKGTHVTWQPAPNFRDGIASFRKRFQVSMGSILRACGRTLPADCPARPRWASGSPRSSVRGTGSDRVDATLGEVGEGSAQAFAQATGVEVGADVEGGQQVSEKSLDGRVGVGQVGGQVEVGVERLDEGADGRGLARADVTGDQGREAVLEGKLRRACISW